MAAAEPKSSGSSSADHDEIRTPLNELDEPLHAASTSKLTPMEVDPPRPTALEGKEEGKGKAKEESPTVVKAEEVDNEEAHLGKPGEMDEEEEILLATLSAAKIVGLPNYRGVASLRKGQKLELRRDHVNVHDKNAIEVRHSNKGLKIGMLSRQLAARLAPLIDAEQIDTEGVATDVPINTVGIQSISFILRIFGSRVIGRDSKLDFVFPKRAKRIEQAKADAEEAERLRLRKEAGEDDEEEKVEPVWVPGAVAGAKNLDTLMEQSVLVEKQDRPTGDLLAELFKEGGSDPSALPTHPCPPGKKDKTMRSELMPFQKQGLAWMIRMEHPELPKTPEDPPAQLWLKKLDAEGQPYYYNLATESSQRVKPVLKRGGILADEMGLGKTMQTIALIVTDDTGEGVIEKPEEPDERYDDMTLIVCPLSVASNWTDQFHHHIGSKRLSWHLYHGEGREVTKKQLRKHDVIITTYQTLAAEHNFGGANDDEPDKKKLKLSKPKEGLLHSVKWRRIVLDEGHVIKNPRAKMSLACAALKAERRWILTGTPIINSTTDLGAMITFLKLCRPLDEREQWTKYVEKRIKAGGPEGARLLRAIVSSTTLRRTKDMTDSSGRLLVKLPEIKFYLHKVKLTPETRELYDEIALELAKIVGGLLKAGTAATHYSHVLVFLLRLRQLACDPTLCPESFITSVREHRIAADLAADLTQGPRLDAQEITRLQEILRQMTQEANEECSICFEPPVDPRITTCAHLFCHECIKAHIEQGHNCPIDMRPLNVDQLVAPGAENESVSDEAEVLSRQKVEGVAGSLGAAKTKQLIEFLNATEKGVKSLVFSQWTSHLNCIEAALTEAGISACRFDGSMTQQKREAVISSFSAPPSTKKSKTKPKKGDKGPPTVMLISLKAGALGLNLTCASQVFLMDPWWQASIEAQAIDRVYRIGQERPVRVFQLVAEDTVEDRVLKIQKKKEQLISQAFSGSKNAPREKEKIESRLQDLADIFGVGSSR